MSRKTEEPSKPINKLKEPRVSCRVPRRLLNRLEKIATTNGIDVSDVVRMALNRVLPEFEKQINPN